MTERQKQMIEAYLPSPPDPELGFNEYYIRDAYDKIQKVYIQNINPDLRNDCTLYGVRYCSNGNRFGGAYNDYGTTHKWDLYDNKEDCRNATHVCYDDWEDLRELQRKEGLI